MINIGKEDRDQQKKLEEDLAYYKDYCNNAAYDECRQLASKILDKWYSQRHQIKTTYANFRGKQEAQKQFENLIESEKKRYRRENQDDDEEEDEPKNKKKQKMDSNQFRIQQQALMIDSQKNIADNKQKDVFKKIINSLKKSKKSTKSTKSNMKLVKLDF